MLTYLGQSRVEFGATFDGTVIGGLSGISYDAGRQLYYVISDDRSEKNPARFYTARLSLSDKGIDGVAFTATHPLLDESGTPFRPLAPNATPPAPPADLNGVSDLVALSDTTFLVLERSSAAPPTVRIYRAEVGAATDVLPMPSMQSASVTPMSKTLAVDLSATPGLAPLDNVEGITLGPTLPDGRQSVVLVSDNNFSPAQVTQFLLFAM